MVLAPASLPQGLWQRHKLKQARRDSLYFIKQVKGLLKKHGPRVSSSARRSMEAQIERLEGRLGGQDLRLILEEGQQLNELVDEHLGFARKSTFREYVESIGLAIVVALLLRAFVVEAFKIPSGSMLPTLHVGDHIFVNKFSYGLRMPFSKWWFWERTPPKRGDVVVFMYPEDESKDFIKRIVAVPGDTLEVRQHALLLSDGDGQQVDVQRRFVTADYRYLEEDPTGGREVRAVAMQETLNDTSYTVIFRKDFGRPNFGPVKVQPGHVFVMGDNRDNSHDSRFWGDGTGRIQVPIGNIKGEAMFIWWSSKDLSRIGGTVDYRREEIREGDGRAW